MIYFVMLSPSWQTTFLPPPRRSLNTCRQGAGEGAPMQSKNRWREMLNGIVAKISCWFFYIWFCQSLTNLSEDNLPISTRKPSLLTMFMNNFVTLHFKIQWENYRRHLSMALWKPWGRSHALQPKHVMIHTWAELLAWVPPPVLFQLKLSLWFRGIQI